MSLPKDITEPETKRARQSEIESESEGNEDKLSGLPDCLLLHILSFVECKDAARTCVLSKRWKHLWKRLPTLILHSPDFRTLNIFSKFVSRLLSLWDDSVALYTLDFDHRGRIEPHILKSVINYAILHNLQQLGISVGVGIDPPQSSISFSIFSCQTLTSLKLSCFSRNYSNERIVFPKSQNLPALTSLYLMNVAFCASHNDQAEPFSTSNKLNNLVIRQCTLQDVQILCIYSTTLSSMTLLNSRFRLSYKTVLCTPNLCSFDFSGVPCHDLLGSIMPSLSKLA